MFSELRRLLRADPRALARETLGLAVLLSALAVWFCLPDPG